MKKKDIVYYSAAGVIYLAFAVKITKIFLVHLQKEGWSMQTIAAMLIVLGFLSIAFIMGIKLYQKGDEL